MAKLFFKHGTMGSSKTANALMVNFGYHENMKNSLLIKPSADTRDGDGVVRSRSGLEAPCLCIPADVNLFELIGRYMVDPKAFFAEHPNHPLPRKDGRIDVIIVDEAQFFTPEQIDQLASIVDRFDVPVMAYGLRTDFTGHLFEGSKRLMEIADKIEEVKHTCWCGRKAIMNARFDENGIIRNGEQVVIGKDQYRPLCRKHFTCGRLEEGDVFFDDDVTGIELDISEITLDEFRQTEGDWIPEQLQKILNEHPEAKILRVAATPVGSCETDLTTDDGVHNKMPEDNNRVAAQNLCRKMFEELLDPASNPMDEITIMERFGELTAKVMKMHGK